MAGDWIKMRVDLVGEPEVVRMASTLRLSEDDIVGKLHRMWSWADRHVTADGRADGITPLWIDRFIGRKGFAQALAHVGWLMIDDTGVTFPNFDRHNGDGAKSRIANTERQRSRRAIVTDLSRTKCDKDVTKSATDARPEKRREEKTEETPLTPHGGEPPAEVGWTRAGGWVGITDANRADWLSAYPACDIDRQLAAMHAWLVANPKRAHKSNWARFVTNWLRSEQDKGGDMRRTGTGGQFRLVPEIPPVDAR